MHNLFYLGKLVNDKECAFISNGHDGVEFIELP